jgi:hypothetical protein
VVLCSFDGVALLTLSPSLSSSQTRGDFPTEELKKKQFDILNAYIDSLNALLFNINGNMQSRFDNNVAAFWLYWRSAKIFANTVSS